MSELNSENEVHTKSFTFGELIIMFRKFWLAFLIIILACTILGGVAAIIFAKPTYTAKSSIILQYVDSGNADNVSDLRNAAYLGQQLVPTVSDLINSESVYLDVKTNNSEYVEKNYRGNLKVTSSTTSLVITISYSTKSGKQYAVETVNQVLNSLKNVVNSVDGEGKPKYKLLSGNVEILDSPTIENGISSGVSVSNNKLLFVIVGFAMGVVFAFVFLIIKFMLDNTIRTRQDLEAVTGFKSIAFIEDIAVSKKKVKE